MKKAFFIFVLISLLTPGLVKADLMPSLPPPENPKPSVGVVPPQALKSIYTGVIKKGSTNRKVVALTLDDGPRGNTGQICNTLNRYGAKATFFFVGNWIQKYPNEVKTAQSCGEVANHTYGHTDMRGKSFDEQYREFDWTNYQIEKNGGKTVKWARPKAGKYDKNTLLAAFFNNLKIVLWSNRNNDSLEAGNSVNDIAWQAYTEARPGQIILLHQTNPNTIKALPIILQGLRQRGYKVVTVSELMNYR